MKRTAGILSTVALVGGLSIIAAAPASAVESSEFCIPQVGQEYIPPTTEARDNPDYVPAVPEREETETTEWVRESPGEDWTEVDKRWIPGVPATYATEWEFTKNVPNPEYAPSWTEEINHPAIGSPTTEVIDTPAWTEKIHHDAVYENKHVANTYRKWVILWWEYKDFPVTAKPQGWQFVEKVYENVKVQDAWTEYIEHPATYKTVPNPDYVAEWTEYVEHPAIGEPTITITKWSETKPGKHWKKTGESRQGRLIEEAIPGYKEFIFERVTVIPGTPAVGEPTILVTIDEGQPLIEEVNCPVIEEEETTTPEETAVPVTRATAKQESASQPVTAEALPVTGPDSARIFSLIGALTIAVGTATVGIARRFRQQ